MRTHTRTAVPVVPAEPLCGHVKKCYPRWSQHSLKGLSSCWTDNSPHLGVQHARALHRVPIIPWPALPWMLPWTRRRECRSGEWQSCILSKVSWHPSSIRKRNARLGSGRTLSLNRMRTAGRPAAEPTDQQFLYYESHLTKVNASECFTRWDGRPHRHNMQMRIFSTGQDVLLTVEIMQNRFNGIEAQRLTCWRTFGFRFAPSSPAAAAPFPFASPCTLPALPASPQRFYLLPAQDVLRL